MNECRPLGKVLGGLLMGNDQKNSVPKKKWFNDCPNCGKHYEVRRKKDIGEHCMRCRFENQKAKK